MGYRVNHLRLVTDQRPLKAVPDEHKEERAQALVDTLRDQAVAGMAETARRARFDNTLRGISEAIDEAHDLAACKRTLKKAIGRARECGAQERADYLDTALDAIEEARRAK